MFHATRPDCPSATRHGPADLRLHRLRSVRPIAPRRPPRADLRAAPVSSATAAGRSRSWAAGPGMIGDPSGRLGGAQPARSRERSRHNVASIRRQLERFLDFSPGARGADARQQPRLARRAVSCSTSCATSASTSRSRTCSPRTPSRSRLDRGLSFTEFSYMLIQAYDFLHLHREWASSCRWAAPTSGATSRPGWS